MHWLFLLLSLGALFGAVRTSSTGLMAVLLLASLVLLLAWVLGWMSARLGNRREERPMIDPQELRRLRELAEARRQQQASQTEHDGIGAP
ncbi:hypothetical protein J5837_05900 [Pseudoxanthomonas helianthi]|uniref:Uncharacterized protein n=1 Tax=Pseudoxanthomonas helianthi TaxID=1453541 RepID=A0A941AVF2_9GAMM|nr:hypothetical protein [Pseudoxanthomonas helianthi]MBP3983958.1 hypothetical protein [Pseudoxanthomonas helianthi]